MKEGFFLKAKQRSLLFKLVVCEGIGNIGILKVLRFLIEYPNTERLSKEEIIQIANITTYYERFLSSWDEWTNQEEKLFSYEKEHQFITILDPIFPNYLKQIYNCPAVLFYQGNIELLTKDSLAFVGSRKVSASGISMVRQLVPKIIKENLVIVSGLAKGIDSISHQVAIQCHGATIGVIGTGLNVFYPKETAGLQQKMMQEQLVISEYPNNIGPKKYHFPMRNRIIAGLSLGTCVIEAKENSGSLITAQAALEYGREVFVVPGDVPANRSNGCHHLIQQGAKCTICAQDILEEINFFRT